ncbi:BamA/TamA family outer membrane protein [Maribacter polysiphoniae]|uniref:BamA/TamA family outer membrane protein n=1 Tax=Maribacter polysiphoniae TaxID=429344 RepID=A0A316E089_9FLAO|nr:BamA/TamA family outer membrane protein [Maribacter polysiphoniae]MBD1261829.1 BamA/TamA family outer membrane protein [Maribacter polysiphoniae]PWK22193.1 surface antigen-like protein [Maribacter polysiphoniae]
MRRLFRINNPSAKISLLFFAIVLASCNALKRVDENELLLTKNTIYADGEKVNNEDIQSLIIQNPNSTLLGYPLRLNLYNLAKQNPDSSFQNWLYKKEKRKDRLVKLLSEKQVVRLGESFLVKGMSEWLKNIGEPPAVIDTSDTRRTLERLKAYYSSKGYFNNNTTYEIDTLKREKRAGVDYKITLGKPYMIDTISNKISSKTVDSIYHLNKAQSFIKEGEQFDLVNFENERKRLTSIFRNSGIRNFQESSINYAITRDSTKSGDDQSMGIDLNIDNLRTRNNNDITTSEYQIEKFKKINIYTDFILDGEGEEDGNKIIEYDGYTIHYKDKLRFKPKTLGDAIFFEKDSIYREVNRSRTYRQITNLNVFKYPSLAFETDSTQTGLTANIYLTERPKYSLGMDLDVSHSNIQQVGLAFSPSLQARNLFKGAENLSLTGRLNVGSSNDQSITATDNRFFNLLEFGADINLTIPRIWFPFVNTGKIIPSYSLPQTRLSLGTSFQKNIGLDKQTFNTVLGYNWTPNDQRRHSLELLNVQFVNNVNPDRFFNVYENTYELLDEIADSYDDPDAYPELADYFETSADSDDPNLIIPSGTSGFTQAIIDGTVSSTSDDYDDVRSIEERRDRLTENNLIFATNYTFNKNNKNGITDNSFHRFRWKIESAGNLLSALSYVIPFYEKDGDLLVFDVPYSQYIKTEFDYIKYWDLRQSKVLAFRSFFGIAVPYGNSDNIPFVRSYFAGGSNDNRAWSPYSLGPGKTNEVNDFNEANLKLAFNLEYRFPVVGDIKGALFADAGNIWNVFDSEDDPDKTFNGVDSLADIALGTGFGIRYDFTYFLIRVDLGFKTYNPAEEISKRWFRDYNFANSVLQIGINYPF